MDHHEYGVMRTNTFLSQCGVTHHSACALWSVSVYTHRRLQWIAIDCTRNQTVTKKSLEFFIWAPPTPVGRVRWRRFLRETAARKSGRSRIGAFLPDLIKVRYHCPWYLLNSSLERWYVWFWFAALLFCPANCELWFTIDLVSLRKRSWIPFEIFTLRVNSFAASLPRIPSYMVLLLFFNFTVSSTLAAPFLNHEVRDRESILS